MKLARNLTIKRAVLTGLCVGTLVLNTGSSLSAQERTRKLHVTKECSQYQGAPGDWCTITASNLKQIPAGSRIFYDQAAGVPAGLLDSNVVLDAGRGSRAMGRCTLEFATGRGLCTFSDGTGQLAGFEARIDVSYRGGNDWVWAGRYDFDKVKD